MALPPRKKVSRRLREQVWRSFNDAEGQCFCCRSPLSFRDDWHCAHVLAHARGGAESLENMRPVCKQCNWQMGSKHMYDWMNGRGMPVPMEIG